MSKQNPLLSNATSTECAELAKFAAKLKFADFPAAVVIRIFHGCSVAGGQMQTNTKGCMEYPGVFA